MPTFMPSGLSQPGYGYDNDPYAAQTMLTTYRHGQDVGYLGGVANAEYLGGVGGMSYLGDDAASGGKGGLLATILSTGQQVGQQVQQARAGEIPECQKPLGFAFWPKTKKAAWEQNCARAKAGQLVQASMQIEPEEEGVSTAVMVAGGVAALGIVGLGLYFALKD